MDYKFGKAANDCSICGHLFADGEAFVSALRDVERDAEAAESTASASTVATAATPADATEEETPRFERLDICYTCWPAYSREALYSWWQNAKEIRPPKPPTADPEFLWLLLSHTLPHHDPERDEAQRNLLAVHLGYLAALGLLRLKHLQLGRHARIGTRALQAFVARESRQREILVIDPAPSDEALAVVEQKLRTIAEEVRAGKEFADLLRIHSTPLPAALRLDGKKKKRRRRTKKAASRPRNITQA